MEIRIALKNNKALVFQFGRETPFFKSLDLISIIIEEYNNHMNVIFASYIKGFFKDKSAKIRKKKNRKK